MENGDITIQESSSPRNQRFFTVDYFGAYLKVTVTSTPSVVRKWIATTMLFSRRDRLRNRLVVGLGVQWDPSKVEPASTLQLCVGNRCLIFQLAQARSVPIALRRFLNDPNFTYVGIWNHSDEGRLRRSDHQLKMCSSPVDLRHAAANKYNNSHLLSASTETLVSTVLGRGGVSKDCGVSMSNWNAEHLDHEQVLYAAVDAYVSFLMGKDMAVRSVGQSDNGSDSDYGSDSYSY